MTNTTRSRGSNATSKPQRRFQFIDNSNIGATGSNSTQVRRHVMQEYMREKRWENRARAEADVLDPTPQSQLEQQTHARRASGPRPHQQGKPLPDRAVFAPSYRQQWPMPPQIDRVSDAALLERPRQRSVSHSPPYPPHLALLSASVEARVSQKPLIHNTSVTGTLHPRPRKHHAASRPRRGLYLTPQSFAVLAEMLPAAPVTPPLSAASTESPAPPSSFASYEADRSCSTSISPTPASVLSAARTDPFDCLPMTLNKEDQELFDFYANVMPACSYGFERRNPRAHNWYLSVFIPEAMKAPVAFQNTVLVHAANTQAWVRGLDETPLAIEHRARALTMLSDHFRKHPRDTSDAAISATLSAAALEDFDPRMERRQYAWLHWRAAMQKIRDRGGPAALEQNKSLRMLINWSDYIFSGYDGRGATFFFEHASSSATESDLDDQSVGRKEIAQQCEELIVFLRCAEHLALVASNLQHYIVARNDQPFRYTVFKPGSPLHRLLASPNGARYTETGQLKQIVSRLAALMTINVAIWEYRYSAHASETFFQELSDNILHNDLDQHLSIEALLQILLSGSQHLELNHTDRPWLVGRLLKVAKRLSRPSWERLNNFLLQCLTLEPSISPMMHIMEHELRAEILAAPLHSHRLPLMQVS